MSALTLKRKRPSILISVLVPHAPRSLVKPFPKTSCLTPLSSSHSLTIWCRVSAPLPQYLHLFAPSSSLNHKPRTGNCPSLTSVILRCSFLPSCHQGSLGLYSGFFLATSRPFVPLANWSRQLFFAFAFTAARRSAGRNARFATFGSWAASAANLSASSFQSMPIWDGIHCRWIVTPFFQYP